jgi:hypothetical protein
VYVGQTGLTPKERFEKHLNGIKPGRFVKKYGVRLRPKLYESYNPMTWEASLEKEKELAAKLRRRGYAVWQGSPL